MFSANVQVTDGGLIEAYAEIFEKAPDILNVLVNRTVNREGERVLAQLRQEPGSVVHPLLWDSDKQRKAYFATNGFGQGIPYKRRTAPNRMVDKWKLVVIYEPGKITAVSLTNDDPAREFVTGPRQQPFHTIAGWYQEGPIIQRSAAVLTNDVETDLIKGFYAIEDLS